MGLDAGCAHGAFTRLVAVRVIPSSSRVCGDRVQGEARLVGDFVGS